MPITKRIEEAEIEILKDGKLRKRHFIIIEEDGVELTRIEESKIIDVDSDVASESERVKAVANSVWTKEVKDAARAKRELLDPVAPEVGR